jgi:hypothetical protein
MPIRTGRRTRLSQRRLALAGLVASAVLVLGVMVAGLTWPGYSHRTQNISDLGGIEAPYPALLNVTLVLFGLLVVAFSPALHQGLPRRAHPRAGPLLVGYFGVAAVVQGLTPCTPGCAAGTRPDLLHGLAATTGILAVAAGMLSYWRAIRSVAARSSHGAVSAWTGTLTLGFLVAWLIAAGVDPQRLHAGVLQRSLIAVVLIWLTATAVQLRRPTRRTDSDSPRLDETTVATEVATSMARVLRGFR